MKFKRGHWFVLLFSLIYILAFTIYYVAIKDYEFLWYVFVLVFFFLLIAFTLEKSKFSYFILWALSIWGLLHMAGGGIQVGDSVLYALKIFPIYDGGGEFFVLKFDQLVHFYGFGVVTLVMMQLLSGHLKTNFKKKTIYFIAIASSMGLGALNEVVEFIAVLSFPETGVGGYYNTAWDLVFNMFGAIIGGVVDYFRRR
ncbi:MAG: DUF2238 domain-containing protein [Candidatus Pacearchaeota archaeon]|nr:DUF2238 domain-containing protein [Candidatus Pacearchaeota archaeon]